MKHCVLWELMFANFKNTYFLLFIFYFIFVVNVFFFFFNSNLTGYVISVRRECVGGTRRGTRQLTCLPLVSCSAASTEGDTSNIGDRSIVVGQVSPKSGLRDLFFLNPKSWNNEQTTETQGRDTTELTQDPVNKLVIKFWDCYQGMTLLIIVIDFFFLLLPT